MNTKSSKKVVVSDALSTPAARAERLRRLRGMAGLTRKQLCEGDELNAFTYKGWEDGRYGGLPIDGAHKIITRLSQDNIIAPLDWLLYGKGQGPYILSTQSATTLGPLTPREIIQQEITLLQSHYPNLCFLEIADDGMLPQFQIGDVVAGIRQTTDFDALVQQLCIVQTQQGELLCRQLKKPTNSQCYRLVSINSDTSLYQPIINDVQLSFAAPITRHYRPIS